MEVKALQQMLSQFRQVQEKLEKQIGEIAVEASAGGGMVTVKMNGQKQLTDVRIEAGSLQEQRSGNAAGADARRGERSLAPRGRRALQANEGSHRRTSRHDGMKIPGLF